MLRIDALDAIYPLLKDRIVVTNMGAAPVELYSLGHRKSFFYMEHAMGLASSVGLGLALCLPKQRIVVVDGNGSVLMNLGTLMADRTPWRPVPGFWCLRARPLPSTTRGPQI